MKKEKSVFCFQEYGRVQYKLADLLKARGMTRGRLADLIHAKYAVVDRLYHGKTERIDRDVLARICYVLDCKLSDIMEYEEHSGPNE